MLFSFALIFLCGIILGGVFNKLKMPGLLGMLITGILIGPYVLNLIDNSVLDISAELRQIALIIILTRAGLNLNVSDLKKVGRPAVMMCFIPASFEIIGMLILAPEILGVTLTEAALLGTVIAAVSPAVIIPKMLKLMNEEYGREKSIPQLIMASASVDDVFVIVLFTSFIGIASGGEFSPSDFLKVPTSIILGVIGGIICGLSICYVFKKIHIRDSVKVLIILSVSFLLISFENLFSGKIGFSGLLAVMSLGIAIKKSDEKTAVNLSSKYAELWVAAEILLFVLVGATVDIKFAFSFGMSAIVLVLGVLLFRMIGVLVSLIKTELSLKERLFCMIAYMPKATVQAAIGSLPLALGLACGNIVLTVAVLSILITAPLGAFAIDMTYKRLLDNNR